MTDTIQERLRRFAEYDSEDNHADPREHICTEAADEIDRLRAELAEKDKRIEELEKSYDKLLKDGWMEWKKAGSPGDWTVNTVPRNFQHAIRRVVITEDDRVVYDAEEDDVGCVYIVTPEVMRTEIRPILDGWDKGHFFTTDQINAAWALARASNDRADAGGTSLGLMVLEELGIVACEECCGSGVEEFKDKCYHTGIKVDATRDCPACRRNGKSHGWVMKGV